MTDQTLAAPIDDQQERQRGFTRYQSLLVALLAFAQFTIILDFIIMSPLGAILMPALNISAAQFGVAVSAYAFSAGISAILSAGFADRFDRKRLLLFFYLGFTLGTGTILLVAWISQAFLQLVLLPIIIVGQNIQARAADKRSESTYKDAEAVLHEAMQIQAHLAEQDRQLADLVARTT